MYGKNEHSFNNQNSDFNAEPTFGRMYGTGSAQTFCPKALSVHHCIHSIHWISLRLGHISNTLCAAPTAGKERNIVLPPPLVFSLLFSFRETINHVVVACLSACLPACPFTVPCNTPTTLTVILGPNTGSSKAMAWKEITELPSYYGRVDPT